MKNTFGSHITLTLFGESHGPAVGAVLDGLAPGMDVDEALIASQLTLRRPAGKIGTARREEDRFQILSGVFRGKTTGTPLTILIPNESQHSGDYEETRYLARPGHADYTAWRKYHGFEDYRGGGHFSGRITAALVAAGAVLLPALRRKEIWIGTHLLRCAGIQDRPFGDLEADLDALGAMEFAALDEAAGLAMRRAIEAAGEAGDSVGGILETAVTGLPAGLGEPWFDTAEGLLAHALFSVPAVKGVQFGEAFGMADARGSEFNDPFYMDDGTVRTVTNHNGGINGGITNGMPVLFQCMVKPTPSIYKAQKTVDFRLEEDAELQLKGRHDPAVIHRARVVVDAVTALVIADLLTGRYGTDYLGGRE
ncbi:MAG: chorismate synthase [Oscillospiraceae bacterium]|nr:chorismate synthase [Oscillospiraceae bacterium]